MLKRSLSGVGLGVALVTFTVLTGACGSSAPLPSPKSDTQFDDPDQPPGGGSIGAVGAGTGKDASADAAHDASAE
jgi:hypothetical protein